MPSVNLSVLLRVIVKVKEGLEAVWRDTKNHEHEEALRHEIDRLEAVIRQLEGVVFD